MSRGGSNISAIDPRERFTNRATYYNATRPGYPHALLSFLEDELSFTRSSMVAEVGSGTGILTELLLQHGNAVFAVEPNADMRSIAEFKLSRYLSFRSVDGSAESTSLENNSIHFVIAGQAFHWFRTREAKMEFQRILKVNGWVVLLWNARKSSSSFLKGYDDLVNWIRVEKSGQVKQEDLSDKVLEEFLGKFRMVKIENAQELDYQGLIGRILSASYSPLPGEPLHQELIQRAGELFKRYQKNSRVRLEYWTEVYAGQLR